MPMPPTPRTRSTRYLPARTSPIWTSGRFSSSCMRLRKAITSQKTGERVGDTTSHYTLLQSASQSVAGGRCGARRERERRMSRARSISRARPLALVASVALVALVAFAAREASAAPPEAALGVALNRFEPSERGSEWFALDSLDFRGKVRPAFGVVTDWAIRSQQFHADEPSGTRTVALIDHQITFHVGAAFTLADRFRLAANLPIVAYQPGNALVLDQGGQ